MPLNSGQLPIVFVMARKAAELERALDWNNSQSCLSMKSSRMAIEFNTSVEVIVVAIMIMIWSVLLL